MLILKNISKTYVTGAESVHALNDVSVAFRKNEFVSVLGPSGCGKTTLLNILGGLDCYSNGDLIINGRHTYAYSARDWDTYRNHSVGFVFQSYNLIPHQSVLANVELALTISGVSRHERRRRAVEVLRRVGLGDQLKKKPNQMSGGQMQRVAIARALVNNPEILLADEPTGALDTETSVQIMELLKEIAHDRLVVMVTHNPELAETYSTRIIRLLDGRIVGDTNPYDVKDAEEDAKATVKSVEKKKKKAPSMAFRTALSLSFRNLMTKKARTILTAFAGSIGIIGIALILAISSGMSAYITSVEQDTLSSYPLVINKETTDTDAFLAALADERNDQHTVEEGKVYIDDSMFRMMLASQNKRPNNLKDFRKYLIDNADTVDLGTVLYSYQTNFDVFRKYTDEELAKKAESKLPYDSVVQISPDNVLSSFITSDTASLMGQLTGANLFQEMVYLENPDLITSQYDLVKGHYPTSANEIVLVLGENNVLSQYAVYALGLRDITEVFFAMQNPTNHQPIDMGTYDFSDFLNMELTLMPEHNFFVKGGTVDGNTVWHDVRHAENYLPSQFLASSEEEGISLKVVGVIRANGEATVASLNAPFAYTTDLTNLLLEKSKNAEIVLQQKNNPTVNVFTGTSFHNDIGRLSAVSPDKIVEPNAREYFSTLNKAEQKFFFDSYTTHDYLAAYDMAGGIDMETPSSISFIPRDFHNKQVIKEFIEDYNESCRAANREADVIAYSDTMELLFSSVTLIIDAITWVLVAFVAISLVVSSIMIGIITYISVLERTKEIGVLRSIGASRRDVANVFNAETALVGLTSGALGILVSLLLLIPINIIIENIGGVSNLAYLAPGYAVFLILVSVVLTMVAGLFPAMIASRKDPVVALRSE